GLGTFELRVPPPGYEGGNIRLSWFVDAGQVWNTYDQEVDLAQLRYSTGLGFIWFSPVGPLTMSVAEPLNDEAGDDRQFFQFSLGSFF
ncbi:MAG: BamA/TamA family outer membrane protein, partial [Ectothiorhodospiraceae bacterium]